MKTIVIREETRKRLAKEAKAWSEHYKKLYETLDGDGDLKIEIEKEVKP